MSRPVYPICPYCGRDHVGSPCPTANSRPALSGTVSPYMLGTTASPAPSGPYQYQDTGGATPVQWTTDDGVDWELLCSQLRVVGNQRDEALARIAALEADIEQRAKEAAEFQDRNAKLADAVALGIKTAAALEAENATLRGAMAADDERLRKAAERVFGPMPEVWPRDLARNTAERFADEIENLRSELGYLKGSYKGIKEEHLEPAEARIAVLEEALKRAAFHGIGEVGSFWMYESREARRLAHWAANGMKWPLPPIEDQRVLEAIAERGGL